MKTRRIVLQALAAAPLAGSMAFAQTQQPVFPALAAQLGNQQRVRQTFQDLRYYVELLRRTKPESVRDAELTLQITLRQYEAAVAADLQRKASELLANAERAYNDHLQEFEGFLKDVGIEADKLAALILKDAMAMVLLVHVVVNEVHDFASMHFCIFPFCFGRPG